MEIPASLKYTASHEWVAEQGDGSVRVGVTALAADQLGELVYVELPQPGMRYRKGEPCAVVESTKAASDVYAPLSGVVTETNAALADAPGRVNAAPYGDGWLFRLTPSDPAELATLLDAAAYGASAGAT